MARRTAPKRKGQPHALSGRGKLCNLDQLTFDRLQWAQHLTRRLLKAEAGSSVLMRRAVAVYQDHLERLLESHTLDQLEREIGLLASAARGTTSTIPEESLIAVPLRAFSTIRQEASEAARQAGAAKLKASLAADLKDWDYEARRRGYE